jgi:hypothetical protein
MGSPKTANTHTFCPTHTHTLPRTNGTDMGLYLNEEEHNLHGHLRLSEASRTWLHSKRRPQSCADSRYHGNDLGSGSSVGITVFCHVTAHNSAGTQQRSYHVVSCHNVLYGPELLLGDEMSSCTLQHCGVCCRAVRECGCG